MKILNDENNTICTVKKSRCFFFLLPPFCRHKKREITKKPYTSRRKAILTKSHKYRLTKSFLAAWNCCLVAIAQANGNTGILLFSLVVFGDSIGNVDGNLTEEGGIFPKSAYEFECVAPSRRRRRLFLRRILSDFCLVTSK